MLPKNHYNVILKNASGVYIGVPSNPFEKIVGLNKLTKSLGDDIDTIQPNQIGIVYTDYEKEELTLKRIYTIGDDSKEVVDLISMDTNQLYAVISSIMKDYSINNPI